MTTQSFDHEQLDNYRRAIEHVAKSFDASSSLMGRHRHARDQWLRAGMLTRMGMKFDGVSESGVDYHTGIDYEHEHEAGNEETQEPCSDSAILPHLSPHIVCRNDYPGVEERWQKMSGEKCELTRSNCEE